MNKYTRSLGLLASWGIFLLMIFVLLSMFSPLLPHEHQWQHAITSYYRKDPAPGILENLEYYACFATSILLLVLFACFHDSAKSSRKVFSLIALCFIIIATSFRVLAFVLRPLVIEFNMHISEDQFLSYSIYNMIKDLVASVPGLSDTLLPGFAELFLIPVFSNEDRTEKSMKLLLLISGSLSIIAAIPFRITDILNSGLILVLNQVVLLILLAYIIKFFRQVKTL